MAPTLTRRQTLAAALAAAAAAGLPRFALAQATPAVAEMSIGDPNAPVTLVEYAMFTCPHCAAFNQEVLPEDQGELHRHRQGAAGVPRGLLQQAEPLGGDDRPLRAGRPLLRHRRRAVRAPRRTGPRRATSRRCSRSSTASAGRPG